MPTEPCHGLPQLDLHLSDVDGLSLNPNATLKHTSRVLDRVSVLFRLVLLLTGNVDVLSCKDHRLQTVSVIDACGGTTSTRV